MPAMAEVAGAYRLEKLWLRAFSGILGALPDHLGQFRVASAYLRRLPPRRRVLVQRMRDGTRASLDLGDRTQGIAYLTRRYEPELIDYIVGRLPADGVFVDVGAHVGLVSVPVARRRPAARVMAVEPYGPNAELWSANRELNSLANAELARVALADRGGRAGFHADADSAAGHLSDEGSTTVDVTTLDRFASEHELGQIDVLKIDTEGGERDVLDGGAELLAAGRVSTVVLELNREHLARQGKVATDVTDVLINAGFRQGFLPPARSRLHRRRSSTASIVDVVFERPDTRGAGTGP
jgi:FkbM family methyltransferase